MNQKIVKPPLKKDKIDVCVVGVFDNNFSSSIFFANGFEKLEEIGNVVRFDYRKILKRERSSVVQKMMAISKTVDLMVICKGNGIPSQAIKLCSNNCRVLFWMMDVYSHFNRGKQLLENSMYCDYRTATGFGTAQSWSENIDLPVYHIIDGSDLNTYYPSKNKKQKQFDVTFIGAKDKERETIYEFLKRQNIRVNFFGPNFSTFVYPDEFRSICNKSKIVLNISRGKYAGYSSLRLWNLLACGSMVLTKSIPKMTEYMGLEANKHLVEFNNIITLGNKVKYYLSHPEERAIIEQNGLDFVKNNRTWTHVAKEVIELVKNKEAVSMSQEYIYPVKPPKAKRIKQMPTNDHKKRRLEKLRKKLPDRAKAPGVTRKVKDGWITK